MRVVVIGAGPVGIAAALGAQARGHEVTLVERGEVGESLRRWGPTRFFTPLSMNIPPSLLSGDGDALLSGPEMADRVLLPLAAQLGDRLRTGTRVIAVGRARLGREELSRHPLRAERPFRILVEHAGSEDLIEADRVLDASGVYGQARWLGAGGVPARGERAVAARIVRQLGAMYDRLNFLAGKRVLLVGGGHSAAHAAAILAQLAVETGAQVTWAVRSANRRPVTEVADDPLPERKRVAAQANDIASAPPQNFTIERRAHVEAITEKDDALAVELSGNRHIVVDEIIALVGYRPDTSIFAELPVEIAPDSEGAARLSRAVSSVTDCLSVPSIKPDDLHSGEPGFFLIGAKSYGRSRNFLLSTGYQQLDTILGLL
jgi:thioredoxin reductase